MAKTAVIHSKNESLPPSFEAEQERSPTLQDEFPISCDRRSHNLYCNCTVGNYGLDVFTKHEHFGIDYSKSKGQEGTYKGYTVDKFRYPDARRLHNQNYSATFVFVRRIKAQRFLYLTGRFANQLSVYSFDREIAVPSAIRARNHSTWPTNQPATGSWLR